MILRLFIIVSWFFLLLFQPSYWCGTKQKNAIGNEGYNGPYKTLRESENFEPEPVNLRAGIQIKDLTRTFNGKAGKKVAMRCLLYSYTAIHTLCGMQYCVLWNAVLYIVQVLQCDFKCCSCKVSIVEKFLTLRKNSKYSLFTKVVNLAKISWHDSIVK